MGEAERVTGTLRQLAACFTDYRDPDAIEHPVAQLVAQRVCGLALGYEDQECHGLGEKDEGLLRYSHCYWQSAASKRAVDT